MSLMVLNINYAQSSILEIASDLVFFNQWQLNKDIKEILLQQLLKLKQVWEQIWFKYLPFTSIYL